jgi:hypothetical protein
MLHGWPPLACGTMTAFWLWGDYATTSRGGQPLHLIYIFSTPLLTEIAHL